MSRARPSRYRAMGSLDVIRKPFVAMELAADIRRIWERAALAAAD